MLSFLDHVITVDFVFTVITVICILHIRVFEWSRDLRSHDHDHDLLFSWHNATIMYDITYIHRNDEFNRYILLFRLYNLPTQVVSAIVVVYINCQLLLFQ